MRADQFEIMLQWATRGRTDTRTFPFGAATRICAGEKKIAAPLALAGLKVVTVQPTGALLTDSA